MADDWAPKAFAWVGPKQVSDNGLELRAVVAEDHRGQFHAGTRYGPGGCAMPELGHQDFWCTSHYREKGEAISAARADVDDTLRQCNDRARTEALLDKATTPVQRGTTLPPSRARTIDR
jgi:hypothetical protein